MNCSNGYQQRNSRWFMRFVIKFSIASPGQKKNYRIKSLFTPAEKPCASFGLAAYGGSANRPLQACNWVLLKDTY